MAIIPQLSLFAWEEIEELGDLERLRLVIEYMPDEQLMEHKTGIITKKEKYCISRWTIIIMRANGQLCFWKKRLQNIIEH